MKRGKHCTFLWKMINRVWSELRKEKVLIFYAHFPVFLLCLSDIILKKKSFISANNLFGKASRQINIDFNIFLWMKWCLRPFITVVEKGINCGILMTHFLAVFVYGNILMHPGEDNQCLSQQINWIVFNDIFFNHYWE